MRDPRLAELAEVAFPRHYGEVRSHEAIGFRRPFEIYCLDPHLFSGESIQEAWRGTVVMARDLFPESIGNQSQRS